MIFRDKVQWLFLMTKYNHFYHKKIAWKYSLQNRGILSRSQCVKHYYLFTKAYARNTGTITFARLLLQWRHMSAKSPATQLFVQRLTQVNNKENIKGSNNWPFVRVNHKGLVIREAWPCHDVIIRPLPLQENIRLDIHIYIYICVCVCIQWY